MIQLFQEVDRMKNFTGSNELRELIRVFERKLGALQEGAHSCCNITMAQCHALVEIGRSKNISLNELSQLLDLESSTMSRTVQNLVKYGYVQREIDPMDRRYVTISLTEEGKALFKKIEDDRNLYFEKVYDNISRNKQQQVLESIQILIDAIEKNSNKE